MIAGNRRHGALGALTYLVLGLLPAACSSCGQTCNFIAGTNHLGVGFITPERQASVYTVNIRGGALDVRCRIHLSEEAFEEGPEQLEPSDGFPDGGARFVHCDSRVGSSSGFEWASWRIRREEMGFEVSLGLHLQPPTAPARVGIEVLRDETVLADRAIRPDYTVTEPAGPGCGLQKDADIRLSLDG